MKTVVVGLGNQGRKRLQVAGNDIVSTVDPYVSEAQYRQVTEVPLEDYDSALVCTSDKEKFQVVEYLVSNGKNVLVEKPLMASGLDLQRLNNIVLENGIACYTAYNHRFEPHIETMKSLIDSGGLGKVYWASFFYGNGTARDARGTWRDTELGVLTDLGSHLLDMALYLFDCRDRSFDAWSLRSYENNAYDYASFGSVGTPELHFEATMLSWRNSFFLNVIGERGSAHISSLCKWGPSSITVRKRKLPSGKPDEECQVLECSDPTWQKEYACFKEMCANHTSNLMNDIWISETIRNIATSARIN